MEFIGLLAVGAPFEMSDDFFYTLGRKLFIEVSMQFIQCLLTVGHVIIPVVRAGTRPRVRVLLRMRTTTSASFFFPDAGGT